MALSRVKFFVAWRGQEQVWRMPLEEWLGCFGRTEFFWWESLGS